MRRVRGSLSSALLVAVLTTSAGLSQADEIMIVWACNSCAILPEPTKVTFDPAAQLFGEFLVRWNDVDFDFTFPNSQLSYVRQWFWDALNGLPVGATAEPGLPKEVFAVNWFGDTYTPDDNACFVLFIGSSGAGPRCVTPPFSSATVFATHDSGTATSISPPYLDGLLLNVTDLGRLGRRLASTVELAQTYYSAGDLPATCAVLSDFVARVEKLARGKKPKITSEQATALISEADAIMAAFGCQ